MPRIANFIPIPGVSELQDLAQGFVRRLRDKDVEYDKRIALASQLESLIECASKLDDLTELNLQLAEIQKRFESTDKLRSRIGLRNAQAKLKIWEELKAKLDEAIQINTLKLISQTRKDVNTLGVATAYTPKLNIIPAYEIISQVEISNATWSEDMTKRLILPPEPVRTSLRAGKYKSLSVSYRTFVADSNRTAQGLVEEEMKRLSLLLHANVATLIGVTEGHNGLNGIVVATDGIDYQDFVLKIHSGAVWAKCIRGFEDLYESDLHCCLAERITIAPDGHLTVLPAVYQDIQLTGIVVDLDWALPLSKIDLGPRLLLDIYKQNSRLLGRKYLKKFLDYLQGLGPAFTELQVIQIASFCNLFPYSFCHNFGGFFGALPSSQPGIGEFGRTTYRNGKLMGWESLGFTRHIDFTDPYWFEGVLEGFDLTTPDGNLWLTYPLHCGHPISYRNFKTIPPLGKLHWEKILTEAQEISQRLNIGLDSIEFCYDIECSVQLGEPEGGNMDAVPEVLYYHWCPHSPNQDETAGFLSPKPAPDSGAWQNQLKQQGWNPEFRLGLETYRMRDDWGRLYEREREWRMETMPGSYPGAYVNELS